MIPLVTGSKTGDENLRFVSFGRCNRVSSGNQTILSGIVWRQSAPIVYSTDPPPHADFYPSTTSLPTNNGAFLACSSRTGQSDRSGVV